MKKIFFHGVSCECCIYRDTFPITYRREPIPTSTDAASSNFIRDAEERSKLRETDSLSIDWETNGWIG